MAFLLVDPFDWELGRVPLTEVLPPFMTKGLKHVPLFLSVGAAFLNLVGYSLAHRRPAINLSAMVTVAWPLLVLTIIILTGSLYTRWFIGEVNTYLAWGLYISLLFASAHIIMETRAPQALLKAYINILIISGVSMACCIVGTKGGFQKYHTEIFLVIPLAIFFTTGRYQNTWHWIGFFLFLLIAFPAKKNTAYLVALLTIFYTALLIWLPKSRGKPIAVKSSIVYLIVMGLFTLGCVVAFLVINRDQYLPVKTVNFRLLVYGQAWERFLDSPLWGTFFSGTSSRAPGMATNLARLELPTHSDILDLLAAGGILATMLWIYGLFRIARIAYTKLLSIGSTDFKWSRYGHLLALFSMSGILTCAVNPVFSHSTTAYFFWANLGLLLGLALRVGRKDYEDSPKVYYRRSSNDLK